MIDIKRLLLTTDFSDYSAAANNYACALADQFDAVLHVIHVIERYIPTFPLYGVDTAPPENLKEMKESSDEKLAMLLDAKSSMHILSNRLDVFLTGSSLSRREVASASVQARMKYSNPAALLEQ